MVPDEDDPWSDHLETQFWPIYPFFRNHKLWPTLHTRKVHFDRMWIFRLKRFFLENFCCQNHLDKSFTCSGLISNCQVHNKTVKKNDEKRKNGNGKKEQDSRVKTRKGSLEQK